MMYILDNKKYFLIILVAVLCSFGLVDKNIAYASTPQELALECQQKIADLEKQAEGTIDAYKKANLYKNAADKGFACLKQDITDFPDRPYDASLPRLGSDDYRETSNYLKYCKITITQKGIDMTSQPAMTHFAMLGELMDFSFNCLKAFTSELYDPNIAPTLGRDELHETTNLVNHCQLIIDKLKSQYDPVHCEPADVSRRDDVVKNLKKVEAWCTKAWNSDVHDPSIPGPRFESNDYGTEDLYVNPVCGIVPDTEQDAPQDEKKNAGELGGIRYAEVDCLKIMSSVIANSDLAGQGTNWKAEKRTLATKDGDYCLLTNSKHTYQNGSADEEFIKETLKVTFTGESDPLGEKLIAELKASEDPDFHDDSEYQYWGFTRRIGRNYFRQVENIFPYCILDSSVEFVIPPLPEGNMYDTDTYINSFIGQISSHQSFRVFDVTPELASICGVGSTNPQTGKGGGNGSLLVTVVVLFGVGGGAFTLYKKGKLFIRTNKKE